MVAQLSEAVRRTPGLEYEVGERLAERARVHRDALKAEQRALPAQLAQLAAERRRTTGALVHAGAGTRVALEERLGELGLAIQTTEARLARVEAAFGQLKDAEIEARWIADALVQFEPLWGAMTADNQARLLRAVLRDVTVQPDGEVVATVGALDFAEAAE